MSNYYEIKGGEKIFNQWKCVFDKMDQDMYNIVRCNSIVQNDMVVPVERIAETRDILFENLTELDKNYRETVDEILRLWDASVKIMNKVDKPEN